LTIERVDYLDTDRLSQLLSFSLNQGDGEALIPTWVARGEALVVNVSDTVSPTMLNRSQVGFSRIGRSSEGLHTRIQVRSLQDVKHIPDAANNAVSYVRESGESGLFARIFHDLSETIHDSAVPRKSMGFTS